jgi:hypothetical protein
MFGARREPGRERRRPNDVAGKGAWMMSQRHRRQPSKTDAQISSADRLIKLSKSGDVQLDEKELNRVSGGVVVEKIGPDLGAAHKAHT